MIATLKHQTEEVEFYIRRKILPLIWREGISRLIFCQPPMDLETLPQGVSVVARREPYHQPSTQRRAWEISRLWRRERLCSFRFPHLAFVLSGTPEIQLGTTVLRIPQDTLLLIPPNVPIDDDQPHLRLLSSHARSLVKLVWFLIAPSLVRVHVCFSNSSQHFYTPLRFFFAPSVYPLALALMDELGQKREGYQDVATAYLVAIFWRILRAMKDLPLPNQCVSEIIRVFPELSEDSLPGQVCQLILLEFPNTLSVHRLADFVGMSPSHLRHLFKKQTGQSLQSYLRSLKLRVAQVLLQQTDFPITVIAHILGFSDPLYFSRWFKRASGFSPSDLRHSPPAKETSNR